MCVLTQIKKFCSFLIVIICSFLIIINDYGAQASDWTSQFHHESETCCQFLKPWFIFSKILLSLLYHNSRFFLKFQPAQFQIYIYGLPNGSVAKESACNARDLGLIPGLGRSPLGRHGNTLQYSCLEKPHGQRNLVGYSPGVAELDTTEWLSTHIHIFIYIWINILLFNISCSGQNLGIVTWPTLE